MRRLRRIDPGSPHGRSPGQCFRDVEKETELLHTTCPVQECHSRQGLSSGFCLARLRGQVVKGIDQVVIKTNQNGVAQRKTLLREYNPLDLRNQHSRLHHGLCPCLPNRHSLEREDEASICSQSKQILASRPREEALAASSDKSISHGITSGARLCCACAGAALQPKPSSGAPATVWRHSRASKLQNHGAHEIAP